MTKITISLTPAQFDALRKAVEFAKSNAESVAKDSSTDVKLRSEARTEAVLLGDVLMSLNT